MAKTKIATPGNAVEQSNSFPVLLTLEQFRAAVLDVFLHYLKTICRMTDEKTAWRIVGLPVTDSPTLFNYDDSAEELGFAYVHIRQTAFARAMEHLYDFAFFGRLDENADSMSDESVYTWVSAIVCDAKYGHLAQEYSSYGGTICDNAQKCVLVAELANARNMLEGGDYFYNGFRSGSAKDKERAVGDDSLTIRQMALLAGMEEMSVRAAANPKRATPLQTHLEDGGTRIAFDVAKAWLLSKGRYVPITWSAGHVDLSKRRFTSSGALIESLNARREMIAAGDREQELNDRLAALGVPFETPVWRIDEPHLHDERLMQDLATLLELPGQLLVLRARETLAIQQLSQIERELREANVATTKSNN